MAKMTKSLRSGIVIFLACAAVAAPIFLFAVSSARLRKNFQKELAKRLETEEAMLKIENERAALLSRLKSFQQELARNKDTLDTLVQEIEKERASRAQLQSAFEKTQQADVPAQTPPEN